MERTVEERLAREEHLTWLLNTVIAYVKSPNHSTAHITPLVSKMLGESAIILLLEYNLKNDSVLDVTEHMELYQVIFSP